MDEHDVELADGRALHAYDDGVPAADARATVVWQHGTPQVGGLLEPLREAITSRGIRWISYDRPGYGGSTRHPGRRVGDAADDVIVLADALGVGRFAALGASGGGPPSLACAALHPSRVAAVVSIAGLAPYEADDWYAGMASAGAAELKAASAGEETLTEFLRSTPFDPELFSPADHEALDGAWGWLGTVAGKGLAKGVEGMTDDDLSYVKAWGFEPAAVTAPVFLLHGRDDRIVPPAHSTWLAGKLARAEARFVDGEGHVSILRHLEPVLDWVLERF